MVKSPGRIFPSAISSQVSGVETVAPGRARTVYGAAVFPYALVGVAVRERQEDVQALAAGRLRVGAQPLLVEHLVEDAGGPQHVLEGCLITRIEVEDGLIGLVEVWQAGAPRMHLDGAAVGRPDQARRVVDQQHLDRVAIRSRPVLLGPEPGRRAVRALAAVEGRAMDAIAVDTQGDWPILEVRQQDRRHLAVVGQQVALGQAVLGPVRLVTVRDAHGASVKAPGWGHLRHRSQPPVRTRICAGAAARTRPGRPRAGPGSASFGFYRAGPAKARR
jgi:hypothetical protein